jgi:isoleucyl-tRNA synthetase
MSDEKKNVYKQSLNLPATGFPMEAKLVQNEPNRLQKWKDMDLYHKVLEQHAADPLWVLHDGPPFANGDIHIGHLINKTLKDAIIRFRSMEGHRVPYVPGWDCHGLPIEHKIQQELGPKMREMPVVEVRQKCFDYAAKYAAIQNEQFQRLGILGDWANPYWTMAPAYEANTLEVFARFVENGLVYKKLKPVPWSIANQTALADAELEYQDVEDLSIFVEFPLADAAAARQAFGLAESGDMMLLVWTTTPWTLPANLAVAVHPEVEYVAVTYRRDGVTRTSVIADKLREKVLAEVEVISVSAPVKGAALVEAKLVYNHPFIAGQTGVILPALYVTTEDGTGLVHTAPGHGEDDYLTGLTHGLPVYCPVLHNGTFDKTAPEWLQGIVVWKANPIVIQRLTDDKLLLKQARIKHSYPHDWRSKTPIIFRATEQWFIGVDKPFVLSQEATERRSDEATKGEEARTLRQRALDAVKNSVEFVPAWGQARITGMLESRPDWCISRQRAWGLPIPVFYNAQGEALLTPESVRAVAKQFAKQGSQAWFTLSPAELLEGVDTGANFPKDQLRKETDIFDVWFESGSSWRDVLQNREGHKFPCDMYLEGSDQHRGWFQLSLLPSLGYNGVPPYRQVLTHGFVVKPDGTKVSKSDKEYVTAVQEINRHGADLLRLWCCSVDYQGDIPTSPKTIQEFGDKYRKIRNTLRYLLSNLFDFEPKQHAQEITPRSLDAWAIDQLNTLIRDVTEAFDTYQIHRAFRLLHDFCAVQVSAVYGNAMKDRLYCEQPNSPIRRRCQTVMHHMATTLTKLIAPMTVFTADEAWEHIKHKPAGEENMVSVHLTALPKAIALEVPDDVREEWRLLMEMRDAALLQLDALKKQAGMNKALDAEIVYHVDDEQMRDRLMAYGVDLEDMVGCGCHSFAEEPAGEPAVKVHVLDRRQTYQACARSWKRRPDVGDDAGYPDLCLRDAVAIKAYSQGTIYAHG